MDQLEISTVIVSFNTRDLLRECIASVCATRPGRNEVIVVDNGSEDGSAAMVRNEFPEVRVVENGANLGFAAATNLGIQQSSGRFVLLLNSDCRAQPGAIAELLDFAGENPQVAVAAPRLVDETGKVQQSCGRRQTLFTEFMARSFLKRAFANSGFFNRENYGGWNHDSIREVDWISGACLLVRREALDQVGLLDERFHLYREDVDWCLRFWEAGWRVSFLPSARVIHRKGGSARGDAVRIAIRANYESTGLYFRKHYSSAHAWVARALCLVELTVRMGMWAALFLVRPRLRSHARVRLAGYASILTRSAALATRKQPLTAAG